MTVYLETSALLRYLMNEDGAKKIHEQLQRATRVIASRLVQVEAQRALLQIRLDRPEFNRLMPQLERTLESLWPKMDFVEMTADICELAGRIGPQSRLRSLDAIHLATYQRIKKVDPALTMLSFDQRILKEVG